MNILGRASLPILQRVSMFYRSSVIPLFVFPLQQVLAFLVLHKPSEVLFGILLCSPRFVRPLSITWHVCFCTLPVNFPSIVFEIQQYRTKEIEQRRRTYCYQIQQLTCSGTIVQTIYFLYNIMKQEPYCNMSWTFHIVPLTRVIPHQYMLWCVLIVLLHATSNCAKSQKSTQFGTTNIITLN